MAKKGEMIKLRIEAEKVDWLKEQPGGMSKAIRRLIANRMACDDLTRRWREEDAKNA